MAGQAGTNLAGDHAHLRQMVEDQALALRGAEVFSGEAGASG